MKKHIKDKSIILILLLVLLFRNIVAYNQNYSIKSNETSVHPVIVSIIDSSSTLSCLLKLHSLVLSSSLPNKLIFKFLIIDDNNSNNLSASVWNSAVQYSFGSIIKSFETKLWSSYKGNYKVFRKNSLKNKYFEKDVIFARFYLSDIFSDLNHRLLYLDNDIIVTADIQELYSDPMYVTNHIEPITGIKPTFAQTKDIVALNHNLKHSISAQNYMRHNKQIINGKKSINRKLISNKQKMKKTAPIAFVFESHPYYASYISSHFNMSNELVIKAIESLPKKSFLNGGVFLMDCKKWRNLQLTQKAEEIILSNGNSTIYDTRVGDQAVFYLMLYDNMAYLPAKYNMRRLPKKTIHLLEEKQLGIVHLAGTTGGNAQILCDDPLKYPLLLSSVLPLYLSVVHSFEKNYPNSIYKFTNTCTIAIEIIKKEIKEKSIIVNYNPGKGNFSWPIII